MNDNERKSFKMTFPAPLKPGATIGLICPSSPIRPEQKEACVRFLESRGFRVKVAGDPCASHAGYMCGGGEERARLLEGLFSDPEVDAIFCARGGDASGRCAEHLDPEVIRRHPKPLVGYSDITTYHLILDRLCGLGSYHGPMVSSNMIGSYHPEDERALMEALTATEPFPFRQPEGLPLTALHGGRAEGTVTGGNLSLLCASIGTPWELETRGRVLFIEEVHESCPRLDRMVWQLRSSGKLKACAGILLGQFTECDNTYDPAYTWLDIFREALADLPIPVLYGLESGHGDRMVTIPLGARCVMDADRGTVVFDKYAG